MVRGKLLVALTQSQRLRRLDKSAGAVGQLLNVHALLPQPAPSALSARPKHPTVDVGGIPRPRKGREGEFPQHT